MSRFPFPGLPRVAPNCARGSARVVSISRSYPCNAGASSRARRDGRLARQSRLSSRKPPGRVRGPGSIGAELCRLQSSFASILPKGSKRIFISIRPCNLRDSESSRTCYHPYGCRGADELSETEKITINLGLVDLGQIDLLVQEGFYQNRTDFIRTAIRNQLNAHADAVKQTLARKELVLGLQHYTRPDLEAVREAGETLEIRVLGLATIADDVPSELARGTIDSSDVLGAFRASPEVKAALAGRIRST